MSNQLSTYRTLNLPLTSSIYLVFLSLEMQRRPKQAKVYHTSFLLCLERNGPQSFKDALSGLSQFWGNESLLKMMKNAFYFALKALSVLEIFKFLS